MSHLMLRRFHRSLPCHILARISSVVFLQALHGLLCNNLLETAIRNPRRAPGELGDGQSESHRKDTRERQVSAGEVATDSDIIQTQCSLLLAC